MMAYQHLWHPSSGSAAATAEGGASGPFSPQGQQPLLARHVPSLNRLLENDIKGQSVVHASARAVNEARLGLVDSPPLNGESQGVMREKNVGGLMRAQRAAGARHKGCDG